MTTPANPIRKSVPTDELEQWYGVGWAYIMPDFDKKGHSKIEWLSDKAPVEPHRVPAASQNGADHERAGTGS